MNRRRAALVQVTPKGTQPDATSRHRGLSGPRPLQSKEANTPEASSRYSPPAEDYTVRPRRHRITGWVAVAIGGLIAILHDVMLLGEDLVLLGRSKLYLLLGVLVAGWSTRVLDLLDRDSVHV